ncbi:unnamed protein product [Lymnaea stagnalis]|uniref:Alpha-type protein kinase domain-containing protein n=1 Tax=Lymnaea stagnalis TaxID=6523 RepID=A0AAV2HGC7_LYMST
MRILCFERDNLTQLTDPDFNCDMYTASFELFPFHEGSTYSVYKGLINGKGPLRGQLCVVRALLDRSASAVDWKFVLRRAVDARQLTIEFNKQMGYNVLSVLVPMLTQMETVSDFTCLFRCFMPHDKRLKREEYVTVEPFIEGRFRYLDSRPHTNPVAGDLKLDPEDNNNDETADQDHGDADSDAASVQDPVTPAANLADAFSHFTWHVTKTMVVCDLKGVHNDLIYTLSTPTIHSTRLLYGDTDGGTLAISEFFSSHRCNTICSRWDTFCPSKHSSQYHSPCRNFHQQESPSRFSVQPVSSSTQQLAAAPSLPPQPQASYIHQPQDPSSYYNCNPAEPNVPLHMENGYQFSFV